MSVEDPNAQTETPAGALPPNRLDAQNVQSWGPLQVFAVHEPELLVDAQGRPASARALGYDTENPHTGFVTFYVDFNGVAVPIERRKAAGILSDVAQAQQRQQQQPAEQQQQQQQPPAEQPQG